jgi:hypothetical protein
VDRTGSGSDEWTTGASVINVIIVGNGEPNANLGDSMRDTTVPAMIARWTALGAVVASEPLMLMASTSSSWVTGKQMAD